MYDRGLFVADATGRQKLDTFSASFDAASEECLQPLNDRLLSIRAEYEEDLLREHEPEIRAYRDSLVDG